jgi:hypothetical protein
LLDNRETHNETPAIARKQLCKYAAALNNGSTVGSGFFCGSYPRLYHSTDKVEVVKIVQCSAVEWSELVGE